MKDIKNILTEQPFFSELKESELDLIAGCGKMVHFHPNTMIGREGEDSNLFYLIRKGKVGIEINHPGLKDNIFINEGEVAGDGIDNDGNGYVDDVSGWSFLPALKTLVAHYPKNNHLMRYKKTVDQAPLEVARLFSKFGIATPYDFKVSTLKAIFSTR